MQLAIGNLRNCPVAQIPTDRFLSKAFNLGIGEISDVVFCQCERNVLPFLLRHNLSNN